MPIVTEHPAGLRLERHGSALHLVLDRPGSLNGLTTELMSVLADQIDQIEYDDGVRVLVLTGAGRAFSSGADVSGMADADGAVRLDGTAIDAANRLVLALRRVGKPVVAAVNGVAAGAGCSIALACDLVIAKSSAYFLMAFANIGLMPDGGATLLLPAAIGRARAMEMAMLAEPIPSATAADWGLINRVVADDEFDSAVAGLTDRLASGPTLSYAALKRAINDASLAALTAAVDRERAGQVALLRTKDFSEGVSAFLERRRPDFSGR
ncbi:enoyl-CoA hydratase/carnithine racemase [Saccharomonospora amisosensis]|uniref:Enoyl-CoA hydratase/carnithine racemase n=1 Tax=Saccharomonospora amisosensis TaxID=1128677 RepID=A0A7X5ZPW7_9PSEU|nr:enoyl-CoA hydratase [Saccharomonospora amisosensis]NIJ11169.1 enoyl-CoA hydratase/carnithine racemase [Saccharomonospora amisosensis]